MKQLKKIKEERDAKIADLEEKLCIAEAKTAEAVAAKDEAVLETEKVRGEFEDFKELDEQQFGGLLKVMIKFLDCCDDYYDECEGIKIINDSEILREIAEEKGVATDATDQFKYQIEELKKIMKKMNY